MLYRHPELVGKLAAVRGDSRLRRAGAASRAGTRGRSQPGGPPRTTPRLSNGPRLCSRGGESEDANDESMGMATGTATVGGLKEGFRGGRSKSSQSRVFVSGFGVVAHACLFRLLRRGSLRRSWA